MTIRELILEQLEAIDDKHPNLLDTELKIISNEENPFNAFVFCTVEVPSAGNIQGASFRFGEPTNRYSLDLPAMYY